MVSDAPLRIVVGANLSRAIARADHGLTACSNIINILLVLLIIYLRAQARECTLFILWLVTRLGTLNQYLLHLARVRVLPVVTQTHTRLHFVHVLTTSTAGAEGFPLDLAFVDMPS